MNNKIIFKLDINEKDSIIAYEKNNYETCYEDAILYLKNNNKYFKIVDSSFCYGFGCEMYYRIYNINDFEDEIHFLKMYENDLNEDEYNNIQNSYTTDLDDQYVFAFGHSCVLCLYHMHENYKVLLIKLLEDKQTHQYKANIIYEYELLENQFMKWKSIIKEEWESRAIIEGERMSGQMSRYEWEKYFLSMRTKNKSK